MNFIIMYNEKNKQEKNMYIVLFLVTKSHGNLMHLYVITLLWTAAGTYV